MENNLENAHTKSSFTAYLNLFIHIHLLDPNRDIPHKEELRNQIKITTHILDINKDPIELIANLYSNMRLLDPDNIPTLDKEVWSKMEKLLHAQIRRGRYWQFADLASRMRILAAHKVEVTKDGICITDKPPEKLDANIPPRPVRKK